MGRDAGFLTAAAALARQSEGDGPHLIYLPERTFDMAQFQADVKAAVAKYGRCVVAVSEGITNADGQPVMTTGERDSHGNLQLSGSGALGDFLSGKVKEAYGDEAVRVRADTFGYLQRSFPSVVSPIDAREARMVGEYGVNHAVATAEPGSVAIRRTSNTPYASECFVTPLSTVAREATEMKAEYINDAGNDVTQSWLDYVSPLVGELPVMGKLF